MQGKGRALISIMAANNETGVIQPLEQIIAVVRAECPEARLHVDAVQAAGRILLSFADLGIDLMTLSAHKFGGPMGAGALVMRDGVPFAPLAVGAQERGRRAGTENVAALAGFAAAADEVRENTAERNRIRSLRDRFERGLKALARGVVIFGEGAERLPNTSNFTIPGLTAETALIALDLDGVALSSGAACSSGKVRASHVLAAMGVGEEQARGGLRVSLGWSSKDEDIDAALAALQNLLARKAQLSSAA
jgi:cysteine desulfurase